MRTTFIAVMLLIACFSCMADVPIHSNTGNFNATNAATGNFNAFSWSWMGYDGQLINVNLLPVGSASVVMRLSYPRRGKVFLDVSGTYNVSNFTASIDRTNLPPDGVYFCEFLGFNTSITNLDTRSLATGMVNIQHSLFQNTTQSSWTNPAGGTVIGPPLHILSPLANWPFINTNQMGSGSTWNGAQWTFGVGDLSWSNSLLPTSTVFVVSVSTGAVYSCSTNGGRVSVVVPATSGGGSGVSASDVTNSLDLAVSPSLTGTVAKAASALQSYAETDPSWAAASGSVLYAEADTLDDVVGRGNGTTKKVTFDPWGDNTNTFGGKLVLGGLQYLMQGCSPHGDETMNLYGPEMLYFGETNLTTLLAGLPYGITASTSSNITAGLIAPWTNQVTAVITPTTLTPDAGNTATVENVFYYDLGVLATNITLVIGPAMTNTAQARSFWLDWSNTTYSITFPVNSFSNITANTSVTNKAWSSYWHAGKGQTIFTGGWR